MERRTHYTRNGEASIAYQVFGEGPVNLVLVPGFISHIENYWTEPSFARWLERLGSFARVAMFDKTGTGLSDQFRGTPGMDERMDDVRVVMDAAGMETATVFGISEGGSLATLFAATHPARCDGLVVYGAFARFSSWFGDEAELEAFFDYVDTSWGTGESLAAFAPSCAGDASFQEWWGRFERHGASPAAVKRIMRINSGIEIADVLSAVSVPALVIHRTDDVTVDVEGGRELAAGIPGARYVELPGADHLPFVGDVAGVTAEIEAFMTGATTEPDDDRVLATLLFTDIVGSTERADEMGDDRWSDVLDFHDSAVRAALARYRGKLVKSTGDGILARFDGPARAVRCSLAIRDAVHALGLDTRAGVHTGEIHLTDDGDVRGISVHVAARIMSHAPEGAILVSRTVKDLVSGSGLRFLDAGRHSLKGVSEEWSLHRVA